MNIYAVYMHDHTGDHTIEVFKSDEERLEFVQQDIKTVSEVLLSDGYESYEQSNHDGYELYVPDCGIYYEWIFCDTELKGV